jgi:hypothetical protein
MSDDRFTLPEFPPHHPLTDALQRLFEATQIARAHAERRRGRYTPQDEHLIRRVCDMAWMQYFQLAEIAESVRLFADDQEEPHHEVVRDGRCEPDSAPDGT